MFRTAWSVEDKKLDGVLVSVRDANGEPVAWDYWPAALEKLIGPWPGEIPDFTDDLIVTE